MNAIASIHQRLRWCPVSKNFVGGGGEGLKDHIMATFNQFITSCV